MMAIEQIPLNLTAFSETAIDFSIFDVFSNANEVIRNMIVSVNDNTNGYLSLAILIIMSVYVFYTLADKTPNGRFRYSDARALGISLGVSCVFGTVSLMVGIMNNLKHLGIFVVLFFLANIYIAIIDRPE
jgi:hypothetical protein